MQLLGSHRTIAVYMDDQCLVPVADGDMDLVLSGMGWRFRAQGAGLGIEDSIYAGEGETPAQDAANLPQRRHRPFPHHRHMGTAAGAAVDFKDSPVAPHYGGFMAMEKTVCPAVSLSL